MTNVLERWHTTYQLFMPESADKDTRSRLNFYLDWLHRSGREWYEPALAEYRNYLLTTDQRRSQKGRRIARPLHRNTVSAHLSTIRTRYLQLLHHNPTIAFLATSVERHAPQAAGHTASDHE